MILDGESWSVYRGVLVPIMEAQIPVGAVTIIPPAVPPETQPTEALVVEVSSTTPEALSDALEQSQQAIANQEAAEAVEPTQPSVAETLEITQPIEAITEPVSESVFESQVEVHEEPVLEEPVPVSGAIPPKRARFGRK